MASPLSSFLSGLQAPSYGGINLSSYAPKKKTVVSGGMSKPTAAQTSAFNSRATAAPSATPTKSAAITPVTSAPVSSPIMQTPQAQSYVQSQMNPVSIGSVSGTPSAPTTAPKKNESAYLEYMRSIFNPAELERQQKERDRISKEVQQATARLGKIQTEKLGTGFEGREAQETRLDTPGGTVGGATQAASLIGRRTNAELARLGVQEAGAAASLSALTGAQTAATDTYNAMLDAGATVYEAEQAALKAEQDAMGEGYTLGKGEYRFDAQNNLVASGSGADGGYGGGLYTAGEDPVADAWVKLVQSKSAKIENVPEEYRGIVAQGLAGAPVGEDPKAEYVRGQADEALTNIDSVLTMLEGPIDQSGIGPAVRGLTGWIPGTESANINAALATVKALVGFDALQKMRESSPTGGALGQITERELAFLQSVQGSLSGMQSTEQLTNTIKRIQKSFLTLKIINSPDGTPFELDGEEYVKQGDQLIPAGSFSGVGGDTNAASIAAAIRKVETGGNYNAKGQSGEGGAYQFMPSTWKGWAAEFLGNPNAPMTPANQDRVAMAKIQQLLNQGYNAQQIALIWNGGEPKVKKGVNQYGVAYDSGSYAQKVLSALG